MIKHYILKDGEPVLVPMLEWAKWLETEARIIAMDTMRGLHVSTVFVGLDAGPAHRRMFETMAFFPDGPKTWTYETQAEALAGHAAAVAEMQGIKP